MTKHAWVALLLTSACRSTASPALERPPEPSAGSLATLAEPGSPKSPEPSAGLEPAPPAGTPLPAGTTLVDVTDGGGRAAFVWRGWFAGDPFDGRVSERIALWHADGVDRTATEAAFELYLDDVRDAGFSTIGYDVGDARGFDFPLSEAEQPLECIVRLVSADPDDPYAPDQEVIEVIVGPRGG